MQSIRKCFTVNGSLQLSKVADLFFEQIRICESSIGLFVCVEVLRPSQPNGVMSSAVSLPNHTFTGQA